MASLETLDQIRDALIGRGMGTSGLTSQAIQRANLPSLSRELATSRGTLANLQSQQLQKGRMEQLKSLRPETITPERDMSLGTTSGVSKGVVGDPVGTIIATRGQASPGSTTQVGTGFRVRIATGDGAQTETKHFKTLKELQTFLRQNPTIAKRLTTTTGMGGGEGITPDVLRNIQKFGVSVGTRGEARASFGKSAQPGGMSSGLAAIKAAFGRRGVLTEDQQRINAESEEERARRERAIEAERKATAAARARAIKRGERFRLGK